MNLTLHDILALTGAVGLFLFGIKTVSESLQKLFSTTFSRLLNVMTKNPLTGLLTGFVLTSVVFSSSSTVVMVLSFVNSGMITLSESVAMLLGADLGSSVITWIVSLLGFSDNLLVWVFILLALGTVCRFSIRANVKYAGEILLGLSLLFLGLHFIIVYCPQQNQMLQSFFQHNLPFTFFENIYFIALGVLLTVLMQSSVASIVFTQVLCFKGIIPLEAALPMVLGQNFGRAINVELLGKKANIHAQRTARTHSLISIFGILWAGITLSLFPIPAFVQSVSDKLISNPDASSGFYAAIGIAVFHTAYNLINVVVMYFFSKQLVRIATNNIASRGQIESAYQLEYISSNIVNVSEISIFEAKKEIRKFCILTHDLFKFIPELLLQQDRQKFTDLMLKIKTYEDAIDKLEVDIANFLINVSKSDVSEKASKDVRAILRISSNLEKIGDICYQISLLVEKKNKESAWFTPQQRNNLNAMFALIHKAFNEMNRNVQAEQGSAEIETAVAIEKEINSFRDTMRDEHFLSIEKGEYNVKSGLYYNNIYSACEKIGDHIFNINEAVTGINVE